MAVMKEIILKPQHYLLIMFDVNQYASFQLITEPSSSLLIAASYQPALTCYYNLKINDDYE